MSKTTRATCVVLSVLCYFFWFSGRGLRADITHDDLMNIYKSWSLPLGQHVWDTIAFFKYSESFRPLGSLFYRLLFESFGMHALPYRAACYGLLLLNLWLAYCVVRRLAHSREVAVVSIVLFAYHRWFVALYVNTGLCYDLLCFCFYMAALLYYLKHRHPSWSQVFTWSFLYVLCLDSKELGVTLPVMICVYELLRRKPSQWKEWIVSDCRIPISGIAINILFIFGRVYARNGLSTVGGYRPAYLPNVYLARAHHFLSEAFFNPHWLTPIAAALFFAALVAAAIWSRWLPLRFAVAWMPFAILPVAFIPERGLDSATIPSLAFTMAIAISIVEVSRRLMRFAERPAALFAALLLLMFAVNQEMGAINYSECFQEGKLIRSVYEQLVFTQPVFPPASKILFVHDPFQEMPWSSAFIVYLHTKDPSIRIYRPGRMPEESQRDFNFVFSYEENRLVACSIDSVTSVPAQCK